MATTIEDSNVETSELATARRFWRRCIRKEVVQFGAPALSTVLADPLMSVVDSLCVGQTSTLQLASLGPALAVFNFCNCFFFFLNAASCVLVTQDLADNDYVAASNTLSTAVVLALGSGLIVGGLLNYFATSLVTATGCVHELIPVATKYLRVRGIGQPVVLVSMVVQAGLLAQKDVNTPMQVIGMTCIMNILGDLVLVPKLGAVGAAWATLIAQVVSLPLLLTLSKQRKRLDIRVSKPRKSVLEKFYDISAPLQFYELGMCICYMTIESLATRFSVISTAAFQALWAPLSVLGFCTYPLKQAAQVFLPRIESEEIKSVGGRMKNKEFLKVLSSISLRVGIFTSLAAVCLSQVPQLFSSDPSLYATIKSFTPYVALMYPMFGLVHACEGTLIGVGDLQSLSVMQIGNIFASFVALIITNHLGMGIYGTWMVFITFIASRLVQSLGRVLYLLRRRP